MKKKTKNILLAILCSIVMIKTQAQVRPIVIDKQLRDQYTQFKGDMEGTKPQIDQLGYRIEEIRHTFPGQENDTDIKEMIDPLNSEIAGIKERREMAIKKIKPVEDSIKKIIKDAKSIPVVWRSISDILPQQVLTDTYTLEGGEIVIQSQRSQLKQGEDR